MFTYGLAYKHKNGDVEGFKGVGFTAESARQDAYNQIYRKLQSLQKPGRYESANVFTDDSKLTQEQYDIVKRDWATNVRY